MSDLGKPIASMFAMAALRCSPMARADGSLKDLSEVDCACAGAGEGVAGAAEAAEGGAGPGAAGVATEAAGAGVDGTAGLAGAAFGYMRVRPW